MAFKRNEGFSGSLPQNFIDVNVVRCPICGSDDPHWTMEMKFTMDVEGNRYRYKCEKCGCIISASVPDVTGVSKTPITTFGFAKALKGKKTGVIYLKIDDVGTQSSMKDYVGKEFTLNDLNRIQPKSVVQEQNIDDEVVPTPQKTNIKANKFCTNCGTPLIPGNKFCGECGNPVRSIPSQVSNNKEDNPSSTFKQHTRCAFCGTTLDGDELFCINCGKKTVKDAVEHPKVSNNPVIPFILSLTLGILLIVFGLFFIRYGYSEYMGHYYLDTRHFSPPLWTIILIIGGIIFCGISGYLYIFKITENQEKFFKLVKSKYFLIVCCVSIILIVASISGYYLSVYEEENSHSYDYDEINFKAHDETIELDSVLSNPDAGFTHYIGNDTEIRVLDLDKSNPKIISKIKSDIKTYKTFPSEVQDNRTIYSHKQDIVNNIGDSRYTTIIESKAKNMIFIITTDSKYETAYIAKYTSIPINYKVD